MPFMNFFTSSPDVEYTCNVGVTQCVTFHLMFLPICTQLKSNCVTTLQICEWPLYAQVEQKLGASCGRTLRQVASRCFSLIIEDSELIWYRFGFFLIINYLKCVCIEKNKYKLPGVCFHLGLYKQIHYMKAQVHVNDGKTLQAKHWYVLKIWF